MKFDDDRDGIREGNLLKIFVSDKDTVDIAEGSILIYSGYISVVEPYISNNENKLIIRALGQYTRFGNDILKDGANTTLYTDTGAGLSTVSGSAADVGLVTRAVIDRFNAENGVPVFNYNSLTIPLTSLDVTYMFQNKKYREALDSLSLLSPAGYFFYVDEYDTVHLKPKPTSPTHIFEFGKHFSSLKGNRSMESLRNVIIIWNGETDITQVYKSYQDGSSVARYGRRCERYIDSGIGDEASADAIADNFLTLMKEPEIRIYCTIFDNNNDNYKGYDIESIQPGDTCRFVGLDNDKLDLVEDNMLITEVLYYTDRVDLTIEASKNGFADWQEKTKREVDASIADGTPDNYTT
jgi:hypothetical protein